MGSPSKIGYERNFPVPQYRVALKKVGCAYYSSATIGHVDAAAEVFCQLAEDADREYIMALYLNARNEPIGCEVLAIGGLFGTTCLAGEVFKGALCANAASLILGHNHPSGDVTPSAADREMTHQAVAAGRALGLSVLDHIIVARSGNYHSMRDVDPMFEERMSA